MKIHELEQYINNYDIKRGTTLKLGKNTIHCIGQSEDAQGVRYVFDNGMRWTKANIISNVVKHIQDGESWGIK